MIGVVRDYVYSLLRWTPPHEVALPRKFNWISICQCVMYNRGNGIKDCGYVLPEWKRLRVVRKTSAAAMRAERRGASNDEIIDLIDRSWEQQFARVRYARGTDPGWIEHFAA
jgi:hypothetical protein